MSEEKPKVMPKFVTTKGKVLEQFNETPRAKVLRITFQGIEDFSFSPGQFANLWFDEIKDENDRPIKRSYSIASSSMENKYLEFCYTIKDTEEKSFTHELAKLKKGDEINIQAAFGLFKLDNSFQGTITLIAAGAGITPLMSIIRTLMAKNSEQKIELFYGFRCPEDFIYKKELEGFAEKNNFELITSISCKKEGHAHEEWQGLRGRITKIINEKLPEKDNRQIYICGPPAMVSTTVQELEAKGYTKEQIKKEEW